MSLFLLSIDSENKNNAWVSHSFSSVCKCMRYRYIRVGHKPWTSRRCYEPAHLLIVATPHSVMSSDPTFLSYWQLQIKHFPWKDLFHTSHELHYKLRGMEQEIGCRYIRILIQDHQAYKSFAKTWVKWDVRPFAKIPTCFQALHSAFSTHHVAHQPAAQHHSAQFLLRMIRLISPQLGILFVVPTHWILLNLPPTCWKFF